MYEAAPLVWIPNRKTSGEPLNGRNIGTINCWECFSLSQEGAAKCEIDFSICLRADLAARGKVTQPFTSRVKYQFPAGGADVRRRWSISFNVMLEIYDNCFDIIPTCWHFSGSIYMIRDGNKTKFLLLKRLWLLPLWRSRKRKDISWIFQHV